MKKLLLAALLCLPVAASSQMLVEPVKNPECIKFFNKGARTRSQQGMEIWGKYLFSFMDGGTCRVYNFETGDSVPMAEFQLESAQKDNHSNQVSFGTETAKGASFPLIYVTIGKPGAAIDWQCMVESITRKGKKFSSKLEQVITLDTVGFTEARIHRIFGAPSWMIDRERGDLWVFSALKRTKQQTTGEFWNNKYIALKFRVPKLSEGPKVTLTADDVLDQQIFDFDTYATQSGCVHDGKLYYSFGFGKKHPHSPSRIRVYDLDRRTIAARYELDDEIPEECEAVILNGDGYMYVNTNSPHIYRIPVPDFTMPESDEPLEAVRIRPELIGGTYYNDRFDRPDELEAPEGYEPFYLSTYCRHGMRYFDDKITLPMLVDALEMANNQNILTPFGKAIRERFELIRPSMDSRLGELTQGGMRQWREAAHRLASQYPTVFAGNPMIKSESTNVMRTAMSMTNFNMELQKIYPYIQPKMDVSSQFHPWLNPYADGCPTKTPLDDTFRTRTGKWYPVWREFCTSKIDTDAFLNRMFTNPDAIKAKFDPIELEYAFFLLANDARNLDMPMLFSDVFTDDEQVAWWEVDNLKYYQQKGPDPMNLGRAWQKGAYMLENILEQAQKHLKTSRNGIHMRFGHDGCLMAMLTTMDADTWAKVVDDVEEVKNVWQSYTIPMASLCSFNFYRSDSNPEILVKVLLNSHALQLPLPEVGNKCYKWSDFYPYYTKKIAEYKAALDATSHIQP